MYKTHRERMESNGPHSFTMHAIFRIDGGLNCEESFCADRDWIEKI